jgi:hypothetical protein
MSDLIRQQGQAMRFDKNAWVILNPIEQSIKAKIEAKGTPLKDWNISIYRGILTGCNEAFIISAEKRTELIAKDAKSAEIIRPILRGRDIKRYGYEFADLYLIATFPSRHYNIDDFQAIKDYLENFGKDDEEYLKEYGKDCWGKNRLGQTGERGARKKTNNKWFETQDSISYWDDFFKQKIIWKRVGSILRFCWDNGECLTLDSTCFATGKNIRFLLAILNSKMGHYLLQDSPKTGTGDLLISVQAVEPLRIPQPTQGQAKPILELVEKMVKSDDANIQNEINKLVYTLYGLTAKEAGFIDLSIK